MLDIMSAILLLLSSPIVLVVCILVGVLFSVGVISVATPVTVDATVVVVNVYCVTVRCCGNAVVVDTHHVVRVVVVSVVG